MMLLFEALSNSLEGVLYLIFKIWISSYFFAQKGASLLGKFILNNILSFGCIRQIFLHLLLKEIVYVISVTLFPNKQYFKLSKRLAHSKASLISNRVCSWLCQDSERLLPSLHFLVLLLVKVGSIFPFQTCYSGL